MISNRFSKSANSNDNGNKPEPIVDGYLSKTAPFDFDVFLFYPDDDDEKRFYIRKLFSRFQEIEFVDNFELNQDDNNYSETRIKKILYSFHQLNHFVYSRPLSEKEIFLLLQYGTMLIQVSAFEVNAIYQQNYKICQQRNNDDPQCNNYHLDLYEEIFIFIDFIQKNKKEILKQLKSYGQNAIIKKLMNLPNYTLSSTFDDIKHYTLDTEINNIKKSTYSENTSSFLLSLNQLDFCVILYEYLSKDNFLFEFTEKYTRFYKLIDAMLTLYKYDRNLFANAPTYFRLFFLFFQYKQNKASRLKEVFNLFRFTVQDLFQHLFFGNQHSNIQYTAPLSFDLNFTENRQNQPASVINSIYSYAKTAHMFSLSPIGASATADKNQYAFYPIAESAFNILSNQLNAWCIKMSESCDHGNSIDYPEILLKYIRHWTAHEYILYQQCDVNISESTALAILQNASSQNSKSKKLSSETKKTSEQTSSKSTPQAESESQPNDTNISEPQLELSKTYRVIYHYLSFLTGIIQNHITKLDYQKNGHFFYEFQEQNQNNKKKNNGNERKKKDKKKKKDKSENENNDNNNDSEETQAKEETPPKIHPFLNFKELYSLAKLLGPDGIRFISDNVMYYLEMNFKGLIDLFKLIVRILKREKHEHYIDNLEKIKEIKVHQNKIAEYFAAIGNLAYLRELLKFVTQTYLRNNNPRLFFDIQRIMAKHNALGSFTADNKDLDYPAPYEEFKSLIDKFDMEDDCGITEYIWESFENKKKNDNTQQNNDNNNNNDNNKNNNNNDFKKSDFQEIAESCIFLVYSIFNSDYFKDTKNDQISFLAIARGIDEFFSLLLYNNHVENKGKVIKIFEIITEFINLIIHYFENTDASEKNKASENNEASENDEASEKKLKFIKIYFQESSYYHQDFVVGKTIDSSDQLKEFKGRRKRRNAPKDFLLIENIELLDYIKINNELFE